MNPRKSPPPWDANEEVSALIEALHETEQRLEELTAGEVDTVADRDGRTLVLRRAEDQLRYRDAAKQTAILNALPAHIALLDAKGLIISVNEAWRRFASANVIQGPGHGIGLNYLEICSAWGDGSSEAHQVAEGIRSVLAGRAKSFSIEYPCHSPTEQRWFLLTVTPLADDHPNGAVVMHLDITERKRASDELRESERCFSDMLGNVQMVSVMVDRDARISYCNDYLLQLTGYRREEVIGRDWFERFIAEPSVGKANFAALLANQPEARHRESEILTRSGERRVIRWNNSVLRSGAGDVIGTASIGEDITNQNKNQESLRQNEERTRLIVESALDAVVVMDATGRITDWNTQAEKTFGWSREQVVGIQLTETIVPPKYREAHKRGLRVFLETGEGPIVNKRIELSAMHRDGHEFPVELTVSPIRLGGAWIFSSFIRDLTEQKRAEQALVQLRRQSELILESVGEGIHGIDLEGKIIFENPGAAKLLGYSIEELYGRPAHATMHYARKDGTPYPIADCPIHTTTRDGAIRRVEDEVFWRKDGSSFPVEYTTAPIRNDRDDITGAVVAFRDITDRKEAENRIRRLNRVYAMLSGINTLIVRVRDRDELFREACRIAVESGQFPLAWVAVADPHDQRVKAVAWAGDESGFLQLTRPTVGVKGFGKAGLSAQAIEKRIPVVCNDIEADGSAMRYAKGALERGYRSAAALPLVVGGTAIGTLVLYAAEAGFFDDEEMKLLVELADDISFALDHIEKEEKVTRLTRVHAVLTDINAAIVRIRDREELFRESCRIAVEAGQLRLAWIGVVDAQNDVIVPAASSGPEKGLLEVIRLSTREDSDQFGMAGRAIRARTPVISNDVLTDKRARFGTASVHRGLRSLAMIPLFADGVAIAVLGLHAAEAGFFDQDEMKLLMEVAGNIAFALEHIAEEEKVRRLTRVHAVLSGINALIVRVRDRDELFREACRIAVEHGQFQMAWIGVVDRSAMKIVPIASAGAEPEFLTLIKDRFSLREDAPLGNTMSARAVREKKAIVSNEIRDDPRVLFAKERIERGISSMAILPLLVSDDAVGVLALYADETGFFDEEEMKLLTELAGDIAFAIDHIEKQERLDYLAYYDVLTGLANRSLFLERVAQYMRSAVSGGHKLALFLIDLERFKNINDSLGQAAGDALLRQVAEWLTRNVGDANLLARVGADHFAVVLPEVKEEGDVARLLEKTMEAFSGASVPRGRRRVADRRQVRRSAVPG